MSGGYWPEALRGIRAAKKLAKKRKDKPMSLTFEKWFIEQFGNRPGSNDGESFSDEDLLRIKRNGDVAEDLLRARRVWDKQKTTALYAWNARSFDSNDTERKKENP